MKKITAIIVFVLSLSVVISCQKSSEKVTLSDLQNGMVENTPVEVVADSGRFFVQPLTYDYKDLEPYIDAKTMEVHYSKHYLGYTNNLNKAIVASDISHTTIEEVLKNMNLQDFALRNNAGGYYNHNLFWENIAPNAGGTPTGILKEAIENEFESFENFKAQLAEAGAKQFGSGWAWLMVNKSGKLEVVSTPNQDNPLMKGLSVSGTPILALDVWEHAYYLNYQNKRSDYIDAFFNIINWDVVAERYAKTIQ
jgi:superoxide dismutase, Fe-Mn family